MRGDLVALGPGLHRLTAHNPGIMTGQGTQSYFIGHQRITLVDPGPDLPDQIPRIRQALDELGACLESIMLTHTHLDHSPAAATLQDMMSVPVLGCPPTDLLRQDTTTHITRILTDGEVLTTECGPLRVIATPGHVGNHLSFYLEERGDVLTGDHVIAGSTVVIIPPSGHMGDYMASLQRLLDTQAHRMLPGHGDPLVPAAPVLEWTLAHRRQRELKVKQVLHGFPGDVAELTPRVYDDVPAQLHPVAQFSLLAHLLWLQEQGLAQHDAQGIWILT
ncbi:MAG: MBL fold metallo-hydrolase [Pseudomonadales bacterium]|nr:MBL fold metallo-hydrolase [Pseudomonadales bacterium]